MLYTPPPTYINLPNQTTPIMAAHLNQAFGTISRHATQGDGLQRIAVPSYFYPTWFNTANIPWYHTRPPVTYWERMQAAAPYAEICIISPTGSGAGSSISTDYVTQVSWARAAGLTILGYIDTNYTAVTSGTVEANVDNYYTWYGVDGIFLDRASANATDIPYYTTLYNYIKAKPGVAKVALNPGTVTDEGYMAICDILCNAEYDPPGYRTRPIATWEIKYPAKQFWHIVYNVPDSATRDEMLQLSRNYRAGYIYFTNDVLPNPYDTLPPDWFWKPLLAAVSTPYAATSTVATYTTSSTLRLTDVTVLGDAGGGPITLTLPDATAAVAQYSIKRINSGTNTVTIATTSSQTIDGATTQVLANQYDAISVASNGTSWFIM